MKHGVEQAVFMTHGAQYWPRIANLTQWWAHLLHRLRRQHEYTAGAYPLALYDELAAYPYTEESETASSRRSNEAIAVPLRLRTPAGVLSFISTTMVFGTPLNITLSEMALETFLPANAETAAALGRLSPGTMDVGSGLFGG